MNKQSKTVAFVYQTQIEIDVKDLWLYDVRRGSLFCANTVDIGEVVVKLSNGQFILATPSQTVGYGYTGQDEMSHIRIKPE